MTSRRITAQGHLHQEPNRHQLIAVCLERPFLGHTCNFDLMFVINGMKERDEHVYVVNKECFYCSRYKSIPGPGLLLPGANVHVNIDPVLLLPEPESEASQ